MPQDELSTPVEQWMLDSAFKFGMAYYRNPAKVIKDRTGEKSRGLGEILTANLNGKVVEYGIKTILENIKPGKKFILDDEVRSIFDYTQPDITDTEENSKQNPANLFSELKNSPSNFKWIGLYEKQFDGIKEYVLNKFSSASLDKIVIVYANIFDKYGNALVSSTTEEEGEEEESATEKSNTLNYLTDEEKKELNKLEKEIEELRGINDQHPGYWGINDHITGCCTTPVPAAELDELRKLEKESREAVKILLVELESKLKALGTAYKNRKRDLLGVYIKGMKQMKPHDFSYFFDISDLRVKIQHIIYGNELESHGELFGKKEIMPDPEIFLKVDSPFDAQNQLVDAPQTKKELIGSTQSDTDTIKIPTEHNTKESYPVQFDDLDCTGKVRIVKIKQTRSGNVSTYVVVCCDSKVSVESTFLGRWCFDNGTCWRIKITNQLGSRNKSKEDILMPKRKADQLISHDATLQRAKKLAEEL